MECSVFLVNNYLNLKILIDIFKFLKEFFVCFYLCVFEDLKLFYKEINEFLLLNDVDFLDFVVRLGCRRVFYERISYRVKVFRFF